AYGAPRTVINATFPSATKPWAEASFEAFFPGWRASFSDPELNQATPALRAEAVIARTLPAFLDSPFANATFDPGQRRFQLGMLFVFRLGNYRDPSLVEAYALAAFSGVTSARPAFFADVVYDLAANAT